MGNSFIQDFFYKTCPTCEGDGQIVCDCNDFAERSCPNCNGKGVVQTRKSMIQKVEQPCDNPLCNGGKVTCGVCKGTGLNASGEKCTTCHGSGKTNCPVCKGIGKISRSKEESWVEHATCHVCNGRGMVECYHCHGDKKRLCTTCKGKGTVLNTGKLGLMAGLGLLALLIPVIGILLGGAMLGIVVFVVMQDKKEEQEDAAPAPEEKTDDWAKEPHIS